jgi:hypothetical protein
MTSITEIVRDRAFLPLECDIPDGMTVNEYRASRPNRRRRMLRLRRTR